MSAALEIRQLSKAYGALKVTDAVSLTLAHGARHALIGPNGAGKTTLLNQLTGISRPDSGQILLDGRDITHAAADQRVRLGLCRTFQINTLFPAFTPLEAVLYALCERDRAAHGWWRRCIAPAAANTALLDEAFALLQQLGLGAEAMRVTRTLAYGKQRLLEIALALALRPRVLLLDEPAAGVPEGESAAIFDALAQLPADIAVLLIEHDMSLVFRFAQSITVLVGGAILVSGTPAEIAADARVREVYLGAGHV